MKKNKLLLTGVLASVLLTVGGCGSNVCSSAADMFAPAEMKSSVTDMFNDSAEICEESPKEYDSGDGGSNGWNDEAIAEESEENVADNRKLIKNVNLSVETEEFDSLIMNLENKVTDLGGYIQSENVSNGSRYSSYKVNRSAYIEARIPQKNLDSFVTAVANNSNITNKSTSVQDVTLTYVDTQSRKEMYLAEQESLLKLLEAAATTEDIVELEKRLFEIRYEIESMESTLRTYDNLVDFSTVYINVNEVEQLTVVVEEKLTTWETIKLGFNESLDDVLNNFKNGWIHFVVSIPYIIVFLIRLAILALVIFVVVKIILHLIRKKEKKNAEKYAALKAAKEEATKSEKNDIVTEPVMKDESDNQEQKQ